MQYPVVRRADYRFLLRVRYEGRKQTEATLIGNKLKLNIETRLKLDSLMAVLLSLHGITFLGLPCTDNTK